MKTALALAELKKFFKICNGKTPTWMKKNEAGRPVR
jgi:hypothetical protein